MPKTESKLFKTYLSFSVPKMDARYSAIFGSSETSCPTSLRKRLERAYGFHPVLQPHRRTIALLSQK